MVLTSTPGEEIRLYVWQLAVVVKAMMKKEREAFSITTFSRVTEDRRQPAFMFQLFVVLSEGRFNIIFQITSCDWLRAISGFIYSYSLKNNTFPFPFCLRVSVLVVKESFMVSICKVIHQFEDAVCKIK